MRHSPIVSATMPTKQHRADDAAPEHARRRRPCSASVMRANQRLNAAKKRFGGSCGCRISAHSAGESVSATMPEITTEIEIVTANWR